MLLGGFPAPGGRPLRVSSGLHRHRDPASHVEDPPPFKPALLSPPVISLGEIRFAVLWAFMHRAM